MPRDTGARAGTGIPTVRLPKTIAELTAGWFDHALRAALDGAQVSRAEVVTVIPGTATKILVRLDYDAGVGPERLCVKGGFDTALEDFGIVAVWEREVDFFTRVAPALDLPVPRCWYAGADTDRGQAIVVLDDLAAAGATFGECVEPWKPELVARGLAVLARLNGQTWQAQSRYPWLPTASPARPVSRALFDPDYWNGLFHGDGALGVPDTFLDRERMQSALHALWRVNDTRPAAICHGDAHIGNTYLDARGEPVFLDWQCIHFAPPLHDAAYFLTGALTVADRRGHERELVAGYLRELAHHGGPDLDVDGAWTDYRLQSMYGYVWALTSPHMQTRERIAAMADRYLTAIEDHDSIDLALRTAAGL